MISVIAAVADNQVIGAQGTLPWKQSADLKHFRDTTINNTVIMGWNTFGSLGFQPLPQRRNIVLTRLGGSANGVEVCSSFEQALEIAKSDLKIFVIGGASLFEAAIPIANSIYLTRIRAMPYGDTYFPAVDWNMWELKASKYHNSDDKNQYPMDFEFWIKRK